MKIFFTLIFLALSGYASQVYYSLSLWKYQGPKTTFEIKPGEGFASINGRLQRRQLIHSAQVFYRYNQWKGNLTRFKAGLYEIAPHSNMLQIIRTLMGKSSLNLHIKVTLPEGKNLFEIAHILQKKKIIKSKKEFIRLATDPHFIGQLNLPGKRVEGYLYPETYYFAPHSPPSQVIKTMVKLFKQKSSPLDFSRTPLNLNPHQVVILASIVEKETGASHERAVIAGVFINRLKKRMRLQSDPTTIYGIFERFKGNLKKKHLREKTPYNTYKISGLPVGPISNPGLASLKAVLNPAQHKYLYFVSQNDGTHIFSNTYRQHLRAVNKYQRNWRARRGKSWRDLHKKKTKN